MNKHDKLIKELESTNNYYEFESICRHNNYRIGSNILSGDFNWKLNIIVIFNKTQEKDLADKILIIQECSGQQKFNKNFKVLHIFNRDNFLNEIK
jgi:hypothetical protein